MRILIATGGSGGHIFPAYHCAIALKDMGHEIFFSSTPGPLIEKILQQGFSVDYVSSKGLSFRSIQDCSGSVLAMVGALGQAVKILKKIKPDVVAGFGGYGAFPVMMMAALLRYPTLIHEQNVVPGRANRLLALAVKSIAISFKETKKYFRTPKVIMTGCPCRSPKDLPQGIDVYKKFFLDSNQFTILIIGGSQGSQKINQAFMNAAPLLISQMTFQVIHIAGQKDKDDLADQYKSWGIRAAVFSFLDEMDMAYRAANLVIARAGAVTICEIAAFGLPSILIPYPFAGGHQKENAKILAQESIASIIEDEKLNAKSLSDEVLAWTRQLRSKDIIQEKFKSLSFPDASQNVAQAVISLRP